MAALSFARRVGLALGFGALACFAFAPFNLFPLIFISFPALYLLLKNARSVWQAFVTGWMFAFAHLVGDLHWMSGALFVDLASFWWVLPLSLCGLPLLLSLYYGIAGALAWRLFARAKTGAFAMLAVLWTLADLARAHFFTGLPWDIAGYVWADWLPVLQSTAWIGIEGLTCVTLLAAFAGAAWFEARRPWLAMVALCVLPVLAIGGAMRLAGAQDSFVPDVRLRLVQADQAQAMKWRADQREANLVHLMRATFDAPQADGRVTHYLWPETATSYYLTQEPLVRSAIAARMGKGTALVTGTVRRDAQGRYYNSMIAMDDRGNVVAGYDKYHLVPFGEYVPLRDYLPLPMISAFGSNFTAGDAIRTIRVQGLPPVGPLVCYEAIFSGEVVEQDDPPSFLLNATNDGWYEGTIGPVQHFLMVRVRAIEEGMPLVRVANKGITAVIDPWGRVTARAVDGQAGFVDADLPQKLTQPTALQKQQVSPVWLIILLTCALLSCGNLCNLSWKRSKKER